MKRKSILFFAGAFLCLVLMAWGYYLYEKPRQTAASARTEKTIAAKELYEAFSKNEKAADKLYSNKVLEVKGTVLQVQQTGGSFSVLLFAGNSEGSGVNCSIAAGQAGNIPVAGQSVKVKGICTGFLMDVNVVDATLVNN
jgi:hypothetical protein